MKIGTMAAITLSLAACACGPRAPRAPTAVKPDRSARKPAYVPLAKLKFDATAGEQVVHLKWGRAGAWVMVKADAATPHDTALLARDRFGSRLVTLRPTTGYDVDLVEVDCAKGLMRAEGRRSSVSDGLQPDVTHVERGMAPHIPTTELKRACALPATAATVPIVQAVAKLRQTLGTGAATQKQDIDKARAMMQAAHRSGADVKARRPNQAGPATHR